MGLLANLLGTYLYILIFIGEDFVQTLEDGSANDFIGGLIGLGAILNFGLFFFLLSDGIGKFKKKTQIYEARGVLMATILAALAVVYFEF